MTPHIRVDRVPPHIDAKEIDRRVEAGQWPDPEELPDELPPVMPYASDLLPEEVGAAVDDIAERMQCPPDYPAAALLVAMASVVGCKLGIRPRRHDDWLVIPNLWGCIVGRPSLKKSPAIGFAEKLLRAIEACEKERLNDEIEAFRVEAVLLPERERVLRSKMKAAIKNDDEESAHTYAEELKSVTDVVPPTPRRIVTTDPTIEKLCEMLIQHDAGMLLLVDELLGWMRKLDRDDQAGVREQYLTLWNGQGIINTDRIGRGELVVTSPCVSVLGCCTPGGLAEYVATAVRGGRGDDGLVQRLQITVWPDPPRDYRHVDRCPDGPAQRRLQEVFYRLVDLVPQDIGETDQDDDEGIPFVHFDSEAQAFFDEWDTSHQKRLRSGDLPEALESHLAKYASLVPSIALLLHLASGGSGPVNKEATIKAVRWAAYLESHANRLYAVATSPARQHAGPLLRRLLDWPKDKPIRASVIAKRGWSGLTSTEVAEDTLNLLAEAGWVKSVKSKPTTGRPTVDWLVHPEAARFLDRYGTETPKTPETRHKQTFGGFDGSVSEQSTDNRLDGGRRTTAHKEGTQKTPKTQHDQALGGFDSSKTEQPTDDGWTEVEV